MSRLRGLLAKTSSFAPLMIGVSTPDALGDGLQVLVNPLLILNRNIDALIMRPQFGRPAC